MTESSQKHANSGGNMHNKKKISCYFFFFSYQCSYACQSIATICLVLGSPPSARPDSARYHAVQTASPPRAAGCKYEFVSALYFTLSHTEQSTPQLLYHTQLQRYLRTCELYIYIVYCTLSRAASLACAVPANMNL
jgi:hypothetical protein